jgi:hypothetical protein
VVVLEHVVTIDGGGGMTEIELRDKAAKLISKVCGAKVSDLPRGADAKDLYQLSEIIQSLAEQSDPISTPPRMFDPSEPAMLGKVTAVALLLLDRLPLITLDQKRFYGAGVYALYYKGDFPEYAPISGLETPIYIGSAEPLAKDDKYALSAKGQGLALWRRLGEHARNVNSASNLSRDDFEFRCLVVKSGLQKTAEDCLINFYKPIWNKEIRLMHGFGKHGDSATTRQNARSPWDTMHPGRSWADNSAIDQKPKEEITQGIRKHFEANPPHTGLDLKALLLS